MNTQSNRAFGTARGGVQEGTHSFPLAPDLNAAYAQMARDEQREAEALAWAEATAGDVADEPARAEETRAEGRG